MTGRILIVDAVATNRIVLKAKLSSSFYSVDQAADGREALQFCALQPPDLIVLGTPLTESGLAGDNRADHDLALTQFITRLDHRCGPNTPPVFVLLDNDTPQRRLSALRAGAADVGARATPDGDFFARMRALLRQKQAESELATQSVAADVFGLAEDGPGFSGPERIVVLADDITQAKGICTRLRPHCPSDLVAIGRSEPSPAPALSHNPDLILMHLSTQSERAGLRSIAELLSAPQRRPLRLMVTLDDALLHLAGPILDMGTVDVLPASADPRELALRLATQMRRKKRSDQMWGQLEHGLQAALTDPLTGLYNRRYAHVFLRRMMDDARQNGTRFAIMMADIDHFKPVNDRFGHAAGDQVLCGVAEAMRQALPRNAVIARVGGEEFLVMVPDTCASAMRRLARRICQTVRETPFDVTGDHPPVHVTVSIGIAVSSAQTPDTPPEVEALIQRADQALYVSKSGGRDTITLQPAA